MIPLRLVLENFMCYRERTEIDFRGSVIWALSGHNGSGKSTIFDAMRYALYGEHRDGKQKLDALIHRGMAPAPSFLIEFDFAIGDNEYRVQRTYSQKKKKGTMQALYLAGPDAPTPGRPGPQLIPGTETKNEFDQWVLKIIGLDERAFTVSVLLLQGQSDKLLKLGGPERHDVLTHIIDLSRYDALAKGALEKQKEQDTFVKSYKSQLDGLEEIDEDALAIVNQQADEAQEKKEQVRQRQLALAALKVQAQRWQQMQNDEKRLREKLTRFEHLLEQSEQIERNAARFTSLQQGIQPLMVIQQKQVDSNRFQQDIKHDKEQVTDLATTIQQTHEDLQKARQQLDMLRSCSQQHDREHKTVQAALIALQIPCNDIARLQQKQQAYQDLLNKLATFAPDLEQQQLHLRDQLDRMSSIEHTIPLLERFADFRCKWQQAAQDFNRINQDLNNREATRKQINDQLQVLEKDREAVRRQVSLQHSKVETQKALLAECQKRSERFHSIEGGATCRYCGQPLTAEHLEAERQRLQEELQEKETALQLCITHYHTVLEQQNRVDQDIEKAEQEEKLQAKACKQFTKQQSDVVRKRDTAYTEAKNQLEQLTPEYLKQIQGTDTTSINVEACLQTTYPTPQDLEALSLRLQEKPVLAHKLQDVEEALTQQQELRGKQKYILSEIETLLRIYPPERATSLLEEREQTMQREGELSEKLRKLSLDISQQELRVSSLADKEQKVREEQSRLEQELAIAEANLTNAQQAIDERQGQLSPEWHVYIPHLSFEMIANWQQEMGGLQGAIEKQQALIEARQNQSRDKNMLRELEEEQAKIPDEARRLPEQVQEEIDQASNSYKEFEGLERTKREEVQRLQETSKRRQELQKKWAEATRLASRYKELARLLGREGLQHYLLQNAEDGIVNHANEILDRISGGTLRLELRPALESKTQALDMVVYNSAISAHEAQSISFLSGSQQFRVAISLAIGIGQYMGNSSHRVESLMIDEGFGSLDASSRDEMTQALQSLEDDFKRVIVVSHQNEFSDKFPNRYEAALIDGCTRMTLG